MVAEAHASLQSAHTRSDLHLICLPVAIQYLAGTYGQLVRAIYVAGVQEYREPETKRALAASARAEKDVGLTVEEHRLYAPGHRGGDVNVGDCYLWLALSMCVDNPRSEFLGVALPIYTPVLLRQATIELAPECVEPGD